MLQKFWNSHQKELDCRRLGMDLATVRDTLRYIESDLSQSPKLSRLATTIREAIAEIERLETAQGPMPKSVFAGGRFMPAHME